MDAAADPASAPALAAIGRLRAALENGDLASWHAAFLDTERALERVPGAAASRDRIDAALESELVVGLASSGLPRRAVEILVLGWTLRASSERAGAHRALFDEPADPERARARLGDGVFAALTEGHDELPTRIFLLERAGRVENLLRVPVWEEEGVEQVLGASAVECCRQFARRRTMFAAERLTRLPETLEGRLHEARAFDTLVTTHGARVPVLQAQLESYGYLERASLLQRMRGAIVGAVRRFLRATAGERWAYEWTQGPGRFAAQWALMGFTLVIVVLGLVAVTQWHASRRAHLDRDLRSVSAWIEAQRQALESEAAESRDELRTLEAGR